MRIHLKLNFDGYAYILLAQGSSGKKAILFPERNHPENNKLLHNQEYVIPQRGVLRFDNTPGTEILQVVASRRPIQAGNLFALAGSTSLMRASDDKSHRSFVVSQDIDKNLSVLIKLEHKLSSLDDSVPLPQTKPVSPAVQLQTEIPDSTAAPVKNEPDQYTSAPVPSKYP